MTPTFKLAHTKASTIPLLYTLEAKKRVASEVLEMLRKALVGSRERSL